MLYSVTQSVICFSSAETCGSRCDSCYLSAYLTVPQWGTRLDYSLQWKLLTGTQRPFFYIRTCSPKYPLYSGSALFMRRTCVLIRLSLEIKIYDPFVIVCLRLTKHRWDDRTRYNHLHVTPPLDPDLYSNMPSNCLLYQLGSLFSTKKIHHQKVFPQP